MPGNITASYLTASFCSSFGVLDDVLECQSGIKHHGLLAGNHLAVYGVVEMSDLQEKK